MAIQAVQENELVRAGEESENDWESECDGEMKDGNGRGKGNSSWRLRCTNCIAECEIMFYTELILIEIGLEARVEWSQEISCFNYGKVSIVLTRFRFDPSFQFSVTHFIL